MISFRAADFDGFRRALLAPRAGEHALLGWHPAPGDLALQLLEWWAYLGDVLTFYNERIANESYLRTAVLPGSVPALVELIGYRPRPAIAATGQIALLRGAGQPLEPLQVPAGLALTSTATPGVPLQTFETSAATFAGASDLAVNLAPSTTLLLGASGDSVLLQTIVSGLGPGDELLLVRRLPWTSGAPTGAAVTIRAIATETDPQGAPHTRVVLDGAGGAWAATLAEDYRLVRTAQVAALWTQSGEAAVEAVSATEVEVHLLAAVRGISPGDSVFFDGDGPVRGAAHVEAVTERFRNVPFPATTRVATSGAPTSVPVAHTVLTVSVPSDTILVPPPAGLQATANTSGGSFAAGPQSWMVTAVVQGAESLPSAEASAPVAAGGSATLAWDAVPGATAYKVYRAGTSGGEFTTPALVATVQNTSLVDTGAAVGPGGAPNPARVLVRFGLRDVGTPIPTPATTLGALPASVTPVYTDYLPAPTGLTVTGQPTGGALAGNFVWVLTAVSPLGETVGSLPASAHVGSASRLLRSTGRAVLTWNAVDGALAYNVYRARVGGTPLLVGSIPAGTSTSWVDAGTKPAGGAVPAVNTAVAGDLAARLAAGNLRAFIRDAAGAGIAVMASAGEAGTVGLEAADATPATFSLIAPVRLLVDLVDVSRGETVAAEQLGTGDANQAGQTFALAQSPLTYLSQGAGYASTLVVRVDGVAWTETSTFYGQAPDAKVFVVAQETGAVSHVRFGDGINGARLPSGSKVVATYRHGAGAASPPAGRLTTILRPQPNLAAVANPVAVSGGADAEPSALTRQNGPRSLLTFGRAISAADYEAVAAQAPGVARARAYALWNPDQQRTLVTVFVGDDAGATVAARRALTGSSDPNRPATVTLATPFGVTVAGTLLVASDRDPAAVLNAATAAVADPSDGLFSAANMGIGRGLHRSALEAALLVDGTVAVHALTVTGDDGADIFAGPGGSADPGQGSFFRLSNAPQLVTQVANV